MPAPIQPRLLSALSFDLDGTLIDSLPDIAASVNRVLRARGQPVLPDGTIGKMVGDGARTLLARAFGPAATRPGTLDQARDDFLQDYAYHCLDRTRPYPGVRETLEALAGFHLLVITNKPRLQTDRLLDSLDLRRYFPLVITPDDCLRRKPDPAPFQSALEKLGISSREMMHVGDSHYDIAGGKAAGIYTAGVTYGIGSGEEVQAAHPDFLLSRFEELVPLLENWRA